MYDDYAIPPSGLILDEDRGDLPYRLIHGDALVAAAAWSAGEAGLDLLDATTPFWVAADRGSPLVLHDALCPLTPPGFLARCAELAEARDVVIVGVRPVTDTIKESVDGRLGATVDRDALVAVCSPVVLPARVVKDLVERGGLPTRDLVELVTWLRSSYPVELEEAPATARRVASDSDIRLLEAMTGP